MFVVVSAFLLSIPGFAFAGNSPGKWIEVNPSVTSLSMRCSFFVNPAIGWAGGRNGCIIHTTDSGSTWEVQQTPGNCWINSLYFHDATEGWAIGSHSVLYTTNGGKQWVQRNIGNDSMLGGTKILFLNKNNGLLYCSNPIRLDYTEDGGQTWSDRSASITGPDINDIVFVNDSLGFLCANKYLARTDDGGKSWIDADSVSIVNIKPIKTVQMIDASIGYCLGMYGMAKTTDAGKTWKTILQRQSISIFEAMHFSCPDTGFALFGYAPMYLLKTNDGGVTWATKPLQNVFLPIKSISFPEKQKGIGVADNGAIYRILSAGDSVFEITRGTGDDQMECIDFGSAIHGFAGTGDSHLRDSALLVSIDGGTTWNKRPTPLKAITSIICFDSNTIIIYGRDSSTSRAMRSMDGGKTWSNSGEFENFRRFEKINNIPNAAYILKSGTWELLLTLDAGKTWAVKGRLPLDSIDAQSSYNRIHFSFFNTDTVLVMSNMNTFRTTDGGSTWEKTPNSIPDVVMKSDICFCSPKTGWLTGGVPEGKSIKRVIFRTDDGGISWREQNNVSHFTDYCPQPADRAINNFVRNYAEASGKQAWTLDYTSGMFHTTDGGEHWFQDTIPASPGLVFKDLVYNKYNNSLWLISEFYGIWKYEIPTDIGIKNPSPIIAMGNVKNLVCKNNGLLISPKFLSDAVSIEVYNISGRLVYSKSLLKFQKSKALFIPLNTLPSAHYLGRVQYHIGNKMTTALFFNTNIIK
jgi:photosystem II stability/assembly factor-like uncharacterized protein